MVSLSQTDLEVPLDGLRAEELGGGGGVEPLKGLKVMGRAGSI